MLICATIQISAAQDGQGRYATHNGTQMIEEMPDGTSIMTTHYTFISFANDESHLLDNVSADCMGRFNMSADGAMTSASGTCVNNDGEGNTSSFWWRMDEMNTADCTDMCGSWGYYAGTGEHAGIKGSGTWERTTQFPNGSSGHWTGNVSVM